MRQRLQDFAYARLPHGLFTRQTYGHEYDQADGYLIMDGAKLLADRTRTDMFVLCREQDMQFSGLLFAMNAFNVVTVQQRLAAYPHHMARHPAQLAYCLVSDAWCIEGRMASEHVLFLAH